MVEERVTDGRRIAELLSSELHGRRDGGLHRVSVVDVTDDVEPTVDGARAYGIAIVRIDDERIDDDDHVHLGDVHVHPERAHVELRVGLEAAVEAARERSLRVRPKAVEPPRTLIFVETGAEVKRAAAVVSVAAASNPVERGTGG